MKTSLIFISLLIFFASLSIGFAQNKKKKNYTIWVETSHKDMKYRGRLITLKDSSIVVKYSGEKKMIEIPVKEIEKLKFRKKGAIGIAGGIGAGVGAAIGIIAGLEDGDDEPGIMTLNKEEKATVAAISLGTLGQQPERPLVP